MSVISFLHGYDIKVAYGNGILYFTMGNFKRPDLPLTKYKFKSENYTLKRYFVETFWQYNFRGYNIKNYVFCKFQNFLLTHSNIIDLTDNEIK